jgi:hypothetical protein
MNLLQWLALGLSIPGAIVNFGLILKAIELRGKSKKF